MHSEVKVKRSTLIIGSICLIVATVVIYTPIALPTMVSEHVLAKKRIEIQRAIQDAYNSATIKP